METIRKEKMMETNTKIGFLEALCILLIVVISHLILTLPKIILQSQGSSSILNIIYITFIALLIVFLINKLYHHFKGMDILDLSQYLWGKNFKFIIGVAYIAYFLFTCSLLVRNTAENLKTMYFQSTPIPYLLFFILLAVGFINRYSLKSVIKCNLMIVAIVVLSLVILFILSFNDFTLERIFPIFGYGIENTFVTGISNIFVFANLVFLFFLMPLLKDSQQFKKISYTSVIISGLFVLLTIFALLLMFPLELSSHSNLPIYLQTRKITLGKFIQRVDAFFVLIWILTLLSYLSIVISFVLSIFKKITNTENKSLVSYTFIAILFGISLLYKNVIQIRQLDAMLYKYLSIIFVFGITFLILLFSNAKKALVERKQEK